MTLGDSWTFGFAVSYEQSYPHHLSEISNLPVVNMGVPAYGSAQALMLLERHVNVLRPKAVIFLNLGLWQRSICHGARRPTDILKPCYWWNTSTERLELITPPPGYVHAQAAKGIYPGGFLTAGNSTWAYFMVSRPVIKIKQILARMGWLSGHATEYDDDVFVKEKLVVFETNRLAELASDHDFAVVLVDPSGDYQSAVTDLPADSRDRICYLGPEDWAREVAEQAKELPLDQVSVPQDGHFADGMNRLVAKAVAQRLNQFGIACPS